ncbi:MAG TPA: imidazole glycerol phosphate synthase subunit HisH [Syntrophaceae bacterium]|jgi:glutamine amidotransferase|nr:imidazole glycerol phosphate synthase subunit HisH [Syntrophaceae bacterium]
MIGIVDYRAGNLTSVARALNYLEEPCRISDDPGVLEQASHIIFPGVGAAGEAMANLKKSRLDQWIREWVQQGKPIMGICLGTQVIFEYSEENDTQCLGIIPGAVKRFPQNIRQNGEQLKIPHMGWNHVTFQKDHPVFRGLPEGSEFYFVHSYYPSPDDDKWIIGLTDYGQLFCSVVAHRNLVATQFHPEKSGRPGLQILINFCRWEGQDAE